MAVGISYMGTKKGLAPAVSDVIAQGQKGVLLDAFAGMCSVPEHVGPVRQIWTNDTQVFAAEVAKALFTSQDGPLRVTFSADIHHAEFVKASSELARRCSRSFEQEDKLLESDDFGAFSKRHRALGKILGEETSLLNDGSSNLFTIRYSNSFFGVRQAIDIDAIVKSVTVAANKKLISVDHRRWLMVALGRALLKVANSTGHFAQFLKPKESSFRRYLNQRRKSIWVEWLNSIGELQPVGTSDWRKKNRSFNQDSLALIPTFEGTDCRPAVVYADPPYTDDQYSRYYHVLDTLMLYDYPSVSGAGLYREHRFRTPFSLKQKCAHSFDQLARSVCSIGADFVVSYPSNGLIRDTGADPEQLLRKHFRKVECCYALPHTHSTFGASKGEVRSKVVEFIFMAKS